MNGMGCMGIEVLKITVSWNITMYVVAKRQQFSEYHSVSIFVQ
jgi:hypothetical protein